MAVNISKAKWDALKPEHQKALMTAGEEVFRWSVKTSAERDAEAIEFLKSKGVKTKVLSADDKSKWKTLFAPAYKAWQSRANADQKALHAWVESLR